MMTVDASRIVRVRSMGACYPLNDSCVKWGRLWTRATRNALLAGFYPRS